MAIIYSRRYMIFNILYGQAIILTLAIVNTYYPEYLSYTFIVFVIAMLVTTAITIKSSLKHVAGGGAKEIKSGRRIIEVKSNEVMEIVKYDAKLNEELKPMLKTSVMSIVNLVIVLIWYSAYFNVVIHYFGAGDQLIKFIGFLLGYEVPFIGLTLVNMLMRRSQKVMIQVINSYTIYDKGIVGSGIAIKFPLSSEYSVAMDPKRKFVEISKVSEGITVKYRLYGKNYDKVVDAIMKFGKVKEVTRF